MQPALGLGFIGLGQAANLVLRDREELARLPFRIVAAAEVRPHALAAFGAEFAAATYDTVEGLCSDPAVDVVYVATGPELHRQHVVTAAEHGKHVIVEKPMALTLDDCAAMIAAAERNNVKLLAGHTHSFDAPIRKMREIIESRRLGELVQINSWNYNEFNPRPWPTKELQATHGPVLNQGPHHVDIIRQLGGSPLRSVRGTTLWDAKRNCEGGYSLYLEFDNGVPATLVYDGRGFFDTAELFGWVGEGGQRRDPGMSVAMHQRFNDVRAQGDEAMERSFEELKELGRYGAAGGSSDSWKVWGYSDTADFPFQPFFGLTVVSCTAGAIRQSPGGLLLYDEHGKTEIALDKELRGRGAELMDMYNAVVNGAPMFHDGHWGMATLEVCLALLDSARERKEIRLSSRQHTP
jgi:phthalate 4,5-cis-dihydrodiol dehydrogenase